VTADGSQSAPVTQEGSQPTAPTGTTGQSSGNHQLRIAILLVVAALVGVGIWLAFSHNSPSKHKKKHNGGGNVTTAIGPIPQSKSQLTNRALGAGQPIYWIGAKKGYHYEFQRLAKNGNIYIRYLPKGVHVGQRPGKLIIVATYPWQHAYKALKKAGQGTGTAGKNGAWIIPSRPGDKKAVLMAYPGGSYEIEVYSPKAGQARDIAASGKVATIAG
jgi:hypothetical protein